MQRAGSGGKLPETKSQPSQNTMETNHPCNCDTLAAACSEIQGRYYAGGALREDVLEAKQAADTAWLNCPGCQAESKAGDRKPEPATP